MTRKYPWIPDLVMAITVVLAHLAAATRLED
jgi:hypothetical protein